MTISHYIYYEPGQTQTMRPGGIQMKIVILVIRCICGYFKEGNEAIGGLSQSSREPMIVLLFPNLTKMSSQRNFFGVFTF